MDLSIARGKAEQLFVTGAAGRIEVLVDTPQSVRGGAAAAARATSQSARGFALVAHPHPLYGGTMDNKVVQTLAHTFAELGYIALRSNFRGVGQTEGAHDFGNGETEDLFAVLAHAREHYGDAVTPSAAQAPADGSPPATGIAVALAGFSFGAHVQTRVAARMKESADAAPGLFMERMALVAAPAGFVSGGRSYVPLPVPADTILIHGEVDTTVPLANVFDWLRPQDIPVTVIPGADHFFHRRLHLLRSIIAGQWK